MSQREVHPWVVLATCCLSLFLVTIDVTIVNVALPAIARDFDTTMDGLQWSIDGYTVVIASFLMLAGSTADRLGRKRIFQIGLGIFSLGSLLCSFAGSIQMLVAFRVVQALGGAMMNPVAMSIIVNTFTDPKQRAQAIGFWGSVFGISMALGPLLGGLLVEHVGWRSIFWVNVPFGVAAILLTARFVPESRAPKPRRIDPVGQFLVVVVLGTLTGSLIEGRALGWTSPPIVAALASAIVAMIALVIYERRRLEPLLDMRFFRSIPFAGATILAVVAFSSFNGSLFLSSLYLQTARGLSPAHAGLCLLPIAASLAICAPLSGKLVGGGHVRFTVCLAGCALAIGAAILLGLDLQTPIAQVIAAFVVFGVAMGMINAPITNTAVSGMPRAQAGVASALASTSRQVGATLGIALSGSIVGVKASDPAFAPNTHPFWAYVLVGGVAVTLLGLFITSKRAVASANAVATDLIGGVQQ
ncbi:MAG: MFS transporter [Kofleriaceae bacterium]